MKVIAQILVLAVLFLFPSPSYAPPSFWEEQLERFKSDLDSVGSDFDATDFWERVVLPEQEYSDDISSARREIIFANAMKSFRTNRNWAFLTILSRGLADYREVDYSEKMARIFDELTIAVHLMSAYHSWNEAEKVLHPAIQLCSRRGISLLTAFYLARLAERHQLEVATLVEPFQRVVKVIQELEDRPWNQEAAPETSHSAVGFLSRLLVDNQNRLPSFQRRDVFRWMNVWPCQRAKFALYGAGVLALTLGVWYVQHEPIPPGYSDDEEKLYRYALKKGRRGLGMSREDAQTLIVYSRLWNPKPVDYDGRMKKADEVFEQIEHAFGKAFPLDTRQKLVAYVLPNALEKGFPEEVIASFGEFYSQVKQNVPKLAADDQAELAYHFFCFLDRRVPERFDRYLAEAVELRKRNPDMSLSLVVANTLSPVD